MNHNERLNKMYQDLSQRGIGKYTYAPPIYRLLWKMGIQIPPPHFSSFLFLFLFQGTFFGIFWGLVMWVLSWQQQNLSLHIFKSALAGLLFGLSMAGYYRYQAKKHDLPLWKDYGKDI